MNNINEQKRKFEESVFYRNNNFILTIKGKYNDFYIDEFAISDVKYTDKEIILTVRDVYRTDIFEEQIAKMVKTPWWKFSCNKNKELDVTFTVISKLLNPLYEIKFEKCFINAYDSNTYAYNNGTIHTYYVKLQYKCKNYKILNDIMRETEKISQHNVIETEKKHVDIESIRKILENSNSMLENCKETVKQKVNDGTIMSEQAIKTLNEIDNAIQENENMKNQNSKQTKQITKHIFDSKINNKNKSYNTKWQTY